MQRKFSTSLAALFAVALAHAGNIGGPRASNGYMFTNFDFPNGGNNAGTGTNANGISNTGAVVGFTIDNNGNFANWERNPDGTITPVNLSGNASMAFGINSAGNVVGQQNGQAVYLPNGGSPQNLDVPAGSTAFGINDDGQIVGQYTAGSNMPGFYLANSAANTFAEIIPPGILTSVNAQGINNNGLIVGFYVGTDGQDHGFSANVKNLSNGVLPSSAIADPTIPGVGGEPGATFVFSQILGINDQGIAVGYYGDSTTSQHGFLYNTNTGVYTFLDDPSEQFSAAGVEVTQITGINNLGEISGFYSDSNGVFHGFLACPDGVSCTSTATPEADSLWLAGFGFALLGIAWAGRRRGIAAAVRRSL